MTSRFAPVVAVFLALAFMTASSPPDVVQSAGVAGTGSAAIAALHARGSDEASIARRSDARPNIVVVMTDDMRVDELAYMPNVRRMVTAKGVRFANSFSPDPLCCPARASFLTGLYSHNHQVTSNGLTGVSGGFGRFDDSHTLPRALHASGYNTGFVGKYLNNYGFAPSRVTGGPSLRYVPPGWTDWYGAVEPPSGSGISGSTYNYFNTPFNINGRIDTSHAGEYQTSVVGRFARDLVAKYHRSAKPFFMYVAFLAPHFGQPTEPGDVDYIQSSRRWVSDTRTPARPDWVRGRFDARIVRAAGMPVDGGPAEANMRDKPSFMRRWPEITRAERLAVRDSTRQRAEALFLADRQIGMLINLMKGRAEWRNTIFVFTSDNGYFLGEHRQRSGKVKAHEPSLRVPLVITGPGIPQDEVRYDPITTVDLTPTILDLANAHFANRVCDSVSKLGMIRHGDQGWTIPIVTEGRVADPRLVHATGPGFRAGLTSIGLRTARYSFIRYVDGERELYDLRFDPNEFHNRVRAARYRDVLRQFQRMWWADKDCSGSDCRATLPTTLRAAPAEERQLAREYWSAVHAEYGTHRGDRR